MDIIVLSQAQLKGSETYHKKLESRAPGKYSKGTERTIIGVIGDTSKITEEEENAISIMTGVENVMRILKPYKLASRDFKAADTIINVRGQGIGGKKIQVIAGPCAVENRTILMSIGEKVKEAGASFIRGGAFKPPSRILSGSR
jgi:3-deoxy-7-phosphoheptulonate synthase